MAYKRSIWRKSISIFYLESKIGPIRKTWQVIRSSETFRAFRSMFFPKHFRKLKRKFIIDSGCGKVYGERVQLPEFEIVESPTVRIRDVKLKRFNIA